MESSSSFVSGVNEKIIQCLECKRRYSSKSNLRKHVKKFHPSKQSQLAPLQYKTTTNFKYSCFCGKNFNYEKNKRYHMKKCHNVVPKVEKQKNSKKCPMCGYRDSTKENLIDHFKQVHNIIINVKNIYIKNEHFLQWKNDTEHSTNAKFVQEYVKSSKNKVIKSYVCHRSGYYVPEGNGKRHLKTKGTNKINSFCPAGLKVCHAQDSNKCTVQFTETHVGHKNDIGYLCLTKLERNSLAQKIAAEIPFDSILDDVRDSVPDRTLQRIHLLTKKDLYNIKSSFNLSSSSIRHVNDAVSVEEWVNDNDCKYKKENGLDDENIQQNSTQGEEDINPYINQTPCEDELTKLMKEETNENENISLAFFEEKEKIKIHFAEIVDNITSPSKLTILKKLIAPISPTLAAANTSSVLPVIKKNPT